MLRFAQKITGFCMQHTGHIHTENSLKTLNTAYQKGGRGEFRVRGGYHTQKKNRLNP